MPAERPPPQTPTNLNDIREAMSVSQIVARRGTLALNQYQREALVRHCGRMPVSKDEAARWKIYLRGLARELVREEAASEPQR